MLFPRGDRAAEPRPRAGAARPLLISVPSPHHAEDAETPLPADEGTWPGRPPRRRRHAAREKAARRARLPRTRPLPLPLPRGEGRFVVEPDGMLVYPDMSCYAVLAVSLINFFSLGVADQDRVAYAFGQIANNLAAGQRLQVLIASTPLPARQVLDNAAALVATSDPTLRTIADWSLDRLAGELRRRHVPDLGAYLLIGPAPQLRLGLAAGLEGVRRAAGLRAARAEPDRIGLETAVADLQLQCAALEITATRLARPDVLALLWRTVNPGLPQPQDLASAPDLAHALAPQRWSEAFETVRTGGTTCRSLYLLNDPEKTSPGWLSDLIALDCTLRLSWHLTGTDRLKERRRLLRRRKAAAGALSAQARRGGLPNLDTEGDALEAAAQAEALSEPTVGLLRSALVLTLQADDPAALALAARRAAGLMRIRYGEAGVGQGKGLQGALWRASLPLAQDTARRRSTLARTETVGNGYPFIAHSPGMAQGIPLGYTARGGELVHLDLADPDLQNGVISVVGKVHSGKTFLTQLLALWTLYKGGRVTVIDQGTGYKTLCDLIGGVYVAPAKEVTPRTINIWDYSGPEERRAKVDFLVAAHEIMLTRPGQMLSQRELAALEEAIRAVYAEHPAGHPDGPIPLEREMVAYLERQGQALTLPETDRHMYATMGATLRQYVGAGRYAALVDRPTTVDLATPLLVFDLEKLAPGLYALMMLTIIDIASRRSEETYRGRRDVSSEMLVVDEGWWVAKYSTAGHWLDQLARRARHIGLLFIFITQQLSDLTDNPTAAAIFNASALKCLYQQADVRTTSGVQTIDWLAGALQIGPDEARQLTTLRMGRMMLFRSSLTTATRRGIVDVRASALDYWIFTSRTVDLPVRRAAIAAAGGDMLAALTGLAQRSEGSTLV